MANRSRWNICTLTLAAVACGTVLFPANPVHAEPTDIALARHDCTTGNRRLMPGKVVEACEQLKNWSAATKRDKAIALLHIGWSHRNQFKIDKANEYWRLAADADNTYIEPLLQLGLHTTDLEGALKAFAAAEKLDPKDWRVFSGRAQMYLNFNRNPDGLRESERAVELAPIQSAPRRLRGQIFATIEAYEKAIEEYSLALQYQTSPEPYSPDISVSEPIALSLARMYFLSGNAVSALATLDAYMDSLPEIQRDFHLFEVRAAYLEALGRISEAAKDLDQAALRSPEPFRSEFASKRDALSLLSPGRSRTSTDAETIMARGNLNTILRVQVFLRNAGMDFVVITGVYDSATRKGLQECLSDMECGKKVSDRI